MFTVFMKGPSPQFSGFLVEVAEFPEHLLFSRGATLLLKSSAVQTNKQS